MYARLAICFFSSSSVLSHPVEKPIGLGVQPAGIEAEDRKRQAALGCHVDGHPVFPPAERDDARAAPSCEAPTKDLGGIAAGKLACFGGELLGADSRARA